MGEVVKHPQSAPGRYWVECSNCMAHGICADLAPKNFRHEGGSGSHGYFVFKQPETPEEERQCHEALLSCPMAAVRDDGEHTAV